MEKTEIISTINRFVGKTSLQLSKHSPIILVVAGIGTGIGAAVLACKATLKVNEVTEESKETIDRIHAAVEKGQTETGKEYSAEDGKKDLTIVYGQTAIKFVKLYGPSIALGAIAITSTLAGYNILNKRYAATVAAYTVLDKSFKDYRGRVATRFGADIERELRYNIKAIDVDEVIVNEDGSETIVTKSEKQIDLDTMSDYSRFFDEFALGFEKNNPDYNFMFLKKQQCYANNRLQSQGHLFLNEVFDMLGMDRTPIGSVVGWIYDPKDHTRDNFVDFGFDVNNSNHRDFVNGREPAILLEFNVDGPIFELI